jgi:hypothetical protein
MRSAIDTLTNTLFKHIPMVSCHVIHIFVSFTGYRIQFECSYYFYLLLTFDSNFSSFPAISNTTHSFCFCCFICQRKSQSLFIHKKSQFLFILIYIILYPHKLKSSLSSFTASSLFFCKGNHSSFWSAIKIWNRPTKSVKINKPTKIYPTQSKTNIGL